MNRSGQPDPLFEDISELRQLVDDSDYGTFEYLVFRAPIGPLRQADVQLAELALRARDAAQSVNKRLATLGYFGVARKSQTGGVPEEQA